MKRFKKCGAIIFLSAYLFTAFTLIIPKQSLAADPVQFKPQVGIPGSEFKAGSGSTVGSEGKNVKTGETVMRSDLLARYIAAFYNWGFSIVGVIAVLMLMAAGIIWLTSGGDSGRIGDAKKMIEGALLGSLLLVGSWFLLNTINPNLTTMPAIETVIINKVVTGCCNANGSEKMTKQSECQGTFFANSKLINGQCDKLICCVDITFSNRTCLQTYISNCKESGYWGDVSNGFHKFKSLDQNCSTVAECKDEMVSCEGVDEGKACKGTNYNCWCYNNIAYKEKFGQDQEPCGNEPQSKCDKNEKQNNKTCNHDLGGRACAENLTCCKFTEDGQRKN